MLGWRSVLAAGEHRRQPELVPKDAHFSFNVLVHELVVDIEKLLDGDRRAQIRAAVHLAKVTAAEVLQVLKITKLDIKALALPGNLLGERFGVGHLVRVDDKGVRKAAEESGGWSGTRGTGLRQHDARETRRDWQSGLRRADSLCPVRSCAPGLAPRAALAACPPLYRGPATPCSPGGK